MILVSVSGKKGFLSDIIDKVNGTKKKTGRGSLESVYHFTELLLLLPSDAEHLAHEDEERTSSCRHL